MQELQRACEAAYGPPQGWPPAVRPQRSALLIAPKRYVASPWSARGACCREGGQNVDLRTVTHGSSIVLEQPARREVSPEFRKLCVPHYGALIATAMKESADAWHPALQ